MINARIPYMLQCNMKFHSAVPRVVFMQRLSIDA
jgi:hypothetical protein